MSTVRTVLPLAFVVALSIVGLGTVIPVLPFQAKALGASNDIATLIYSIFSAVSFIAAPLWGRASDRIGRKPVMTASLCVAVVSYLWLSQVTSLWELYACRALAGVSTGLMAAGFAWVADVTAPEHRAAGLGVLGAAFGVGFMVGPGIGAIVAGASSSGAPNYVLPALIAAACNGAALAAALLLVREPSRHRVATRTPKLTLLRTPALARLMLIYFCVSLLFTGVEGGFALWGAARFGIGPREVGLILFVVGGVTVLTQGGVGALTRRYGEKHLLIGSIALLLLAFLLMPLASGPWSVLGAVALFAVGIGLHTPTLQSLLSRHTPMTHQGNIMGTAQSASSLARVFGPAWAGFMLEQYAPNALFLVGAAALLPILALTVVTVRGLQDPAP